MIIMRAGDEIHSAFCPPESVLIIESPLCYANELKPIATRNGKKAFLDRNNFIHSIATEIPCPNLKYAYAYRDRIKDNNIILQGIQTITYAMHKPSVTYDITNLLDKKSLEHLILFEEKTLNDDQSEGDNATLTTLIALHYRRHATKIQIAIFSYRLAIDIILLIAGLVNGLPLIKSLGLASGSVKKFIDFSNYLNQHKLNLSDKVNKLKRKQLGVDSEANLSKITSHHLQTLYDSLLDLTNRCEMLEVTVNELKSTLDLTSVDSSSHPSSSSTPTLTQRPEPLPLPSTVNPSE